MDTSRTKGDLRAAELSAALSRLHKVHNDMSILQVRTFLAVAARPGVPQRTLLEELGIGNDPASDSTVSRAMAVLSSAPAKPGRKKGLGLVEFHENPHDRREKFVFLTKDGKRIWDDIARDLPGRK